MRAGIRHQTDIALAVAEADQLLAEEHYANRVAGWLHLGGEHRGDPILPHQVAQRRAGSDSGDQLVVFLAEHDLLLTRHCARSQTTVSLLSWLHVPAACSRLYDNSVGGSNRQSCWTRLWKSPTRR